MAQKRKTSMLIARLTADLLGRIDAVVRNSQHPDVTNRSSAVREALTDWLPKQEAAIDRALGESKKG